MTNLTRIEDLKAGDTLMVTEGAWGRTWYLVHDVEAKFDGEEFTVTYGNDSGRWTEVAHYEAGAMVEASPAHVANAAALSSVTNRLLSDVLGCAVPMMEAAE